MSKLGKWLRRELSGPTLRRDFIRGLPFWLVTVAMVINALLIDKKPGRPLFGTMVIHRGGMLAVLVPGIIAIGLERRRRDAAAPT